MQLRRFVADFFSLRRQAISTGGCAGRRHEGETQATQAIQVQGDLTGTCVHGWHLLPRYTCRFPLFIPLSTKSLIMSHKSRAYTRSPSSIDLTVIALTGRFYPHQTAIRFVLSVSLRGSESHSKLRKETIDFVYRHDFGLGLFCSRGQRSIIELSTGTTVS